MLCYRCQRFSLHKLTRLPQQTGTYPLTHAHRGAKAGCSFCSLLEQPVDRSQQHYESEERMRFYLECQIDLSQNSYGERLSLPAGQSSRRDEFCFPSRGSSTFRRPSTSPSVSGGCNHVNIPWLLLGNRRQKPHLGRQGSVE